MHIEERSNEGPRLSVKTKKHARACRRTIERGATAFSENKKVKTKHNETNVTPEKDVTFANQTPGGYKFAPLVASQLWRANQHELACFGISSSWSFPSRSGIRLHVVVSPGFLCSDPFRHETFRPLFRRPATSPFVLGCSRLLVGVDAESSEVVQETPHQLSFLAPHTARAPHQFSEHHALRQSRILHARHKSRKQDPPPA